ncbi:MAG: hypothetical protein JXA90_03940 [Planctomycetes bacterium]|nr:hypothetical protein [Planctomycetota bacterium]
MALSIGLPSLWDLAPRRTPAGGGAGDGRGAAAPPPTDAFRFSLGEAHLDDIGSLYYQRRYLLSAPGAGLEDVAACEQRLLNHADAVALGGELALGLAASCLEHDDPADVFAGAFVLGMVSGGDSIDRLRGAWDAIEDEDLLTALSDACRLAPHPGLAEMLEALLGCDRALVREKALAALGGRGEITLDALRRSLEDGDVIVRVEASRHVIHGDGSLVPMLARGLHHDSPLVKASAAEALLILGRREGLEFCRWRLREEGADPQAHAAAVPLALAGSREDLEILESAWDASGGSAGLALALGLLGDLRALKILVGGLQHEERRIARACAAALERITGAGIYPEGASWAEGEPDLDLDGEPEEDSEGEPEPGEEASVAAAGEESAAVREPSGAEAGLSYEVWYEECRAALSRWDRGLRYRGGESMHPSRLIEELSTRHQPTAERERLHRELVVRTGLRAPLAAAGFIARQRRDMEVWRRWSLEEGARIARGAWTFAGQPQ